MTLPTSAPSRRPKPPLEGPAPSVGVAATDAPSVRTLDLAEDVAFVADLYARGGPAPSDYLAFEDWLDGLFERYDAGDIDDIALKTLRHAMPRAWTAETSQGRAFLKLRGYAGDFEIIDWIYRQATSSDPLLRRWDDYFHQSSAPTAVRNRKQFFKTSLADRLERTEGPVRVLNLASGPCRDVAEFFAEHPQADVRMTCVDQDENAIAFARSLCTPVLERLAFARSNVFRFRSQERYDWIWSAGLFDYLPDEHFCRLLSRTRSFAAPGARIVVGNFSSENPGRSYMRFGEWHLIHRSADELRRLAFAAGFAEDRVQVDCEPLGVNLFLTIDCD